MTEASQLLLDFSKRILQTYITRFDPRAAMVTGSAAEGESDFYSDLDMTVYYDELPSEEELHAARLANGGSERLWLLGDRSEGSIAESYSVGGMECQIGHAIVSVWEQDIAAAMSGEDVTSPMQKALSGTLNCIALHGNDLIQKWKEEISAYPDVLAQAMVETNLTFFPVWSLQERFFARDATVWWHQILVESAQKMLGILAGLNRVYYTSFQFKRMGKFIDSLTVLPPNFAARLESLFCDEPQIAAPNLEQLVKEILELVEQQMPQIDLTTARKKIGWRQQAWTPDALLSGASS